MNWERRLPPVAEDALDILCEATEREIGPTDGDDEYDFSNADFSNEEAEATLVADEEFTKADAAYALDLLQRRGHIYYVDEEVYITPRSSERQFVCMRRAANRG